jgi:cation:H+ antiporter
MMNYVLLLTGIILLIFGVNMLVDSAGKIAKYFKVPAFIIGLTIVAFGTSAPEATIGVVSAIEKANQLALGDVVGSSIVNILLVLGLSAIVMPIKVDRFVLYRQVPILFFVQAILLVMLLTNSTVARWEGALLVVGFCVFLWQIILYAKKTKEKIAFKTEEEREIQQILKSEEIFAEDDETAFGEKRNKKEVNVLYESARFVIGLALLIGGANLAVSSAVAIAQYYNLSKEFIGLTIIALGTSLPEIATTFVAALRGEDEIAIGNIVGSNLFNILFVLGLSSSIHGIGAAKTMFIDVIFMIGITCLLFISAYLHKDISRKDGILYVSLYILYMALKIMGIF